MIFEDINLFYSCLQKNKRLIALDIGTKKIGIAITDLSKTISNPHSVIIRKNIKKDFESISKIIQDEYDGFIIGYPIAMNGDKGNSCAKIYEFAKLILKYFNLPIYLQDERLSTKGAYSYLSVTNLNRKQKNEIDDKISSSLILEIVLSKLKNIPFQNY